MERGNRFGGFSTKEILTAVVALGALAILLSGVDGRVPVASSETKFFELSAAGLQIVPASCPSSPHYSGACSGVPSPSVCSIVSNPSTITSGQSSTIGWNSNAGGMFSSGVTYVINPTIGSVGSSGTRAVSPTQTTQYTFTVTTPATRRTAEATYNCQTTVSVNAPPSVCPAGQTWNGTQCVCPAGLTWNGTQCVGTPSCPAGQTWNGTQCVCPAGQTWNGTQCVADGGSCPIGYTRNGAGNCVYTGCPSGYILVNGQCVLEPQQCTPMNFCAGPDINGDGVGDEIWRRDAQCTESRVNESCPFGCSGGGCLPAPPGQGNITAQPSLVRSGERSTITWSTNEMEPGSCTVSEDNPEISDSRSGQNSGTFLSSSIRQQTTYTLRCTSLDGTTFTDSARVNVIPSWEET